MKTFLICVILSASLVLTSCATIFPVHNPNISRDEFAGLVAAESDLTACYERGFRGFTLLLDFVLGAPFLFIPLIWDGVSGKYTVYYYHHKRCEKMKMEKRNAKTSPTTVINVHSEPDPAFATKKTNPVPSEHKKESVYSAPVKANTQSKPMPLAKPITESKPATIQEPSYPAVEDDDEYEVLY